MVSTRNKVLQTRSYLLWMYTTIFQLKVNISSGPHRRAFSWRWWRRCCPRWHWRPSSGWWESTAATTPTDRRPWGSPAVATTRAACRRQGSASCLWPPVAARGPPIGSRRDRPSLEEIDCKETMFYFFNLFKHLTSYCVTKLFLNTFISITQKWIQSPP